VVAVSFASNGKKKNCWTNEGRIAVTIAQSILREFEEQAPVTRQLLERLPEDRLTWKPHERSLSAGQLAFHLAFVPGGVVRREQKSPTQATDFNFPQPASREEILETFEESVATIRSLLPEYDDKEMQEIWRWSREKRNYGLCPTRSFFATSCSMTGTASWPVQRLFEDAQCARAGELGT
jgi:hypothetical protein